MTPDRLKSIEIERIFLRDDVVKRAVNSDAVSELVDSIRISGLHTPIRVRPLVKYNSGVRSEAWELIAGRHRVEAAKLLGWLEIDANVEDIDDTRAELGMIDENLCRSDLEPAERVYAVDRRKELYELLFPDTRREATLKQNTPSRNNCETDKPERFTLNTAKATGKSERAIQLDATIGKKLKGDALDLVGTSLNSITELDALSKLPPQERRSLMDRAIAGEQVSAKAARPKKATTSEDGARSPDVAKSAPIPMIDLTSPEHEHVVLAVGEAVAEASFFPSNDGDRREDASRNDTGADEGETTTLSSPLVDTIRAAEEEAIALTRAILDEFLGRFSLLSADQRVACLRGRDLFDLFEAYTEA